MATTSNLNYRTHNTEPAIDFVSNLRLTIITKIADPGFGIAQLAEHMKMSPTTLGRKLLAPGGQTPGKLITQERLRIATLLLIENRLTTKEIVQRCGFSEITSFSRKFRRYFGSTPIEFREQKKRERNESTGVNWKMPLDKKDLEQLVELSHKNPWLAKLLKVVINNIGNETLTLKQLANELFISTSSLNRKMNQTLQISTQKFVRNIRLNHASELLALGKESVGNVASRAGFFDSAHLCRYFRPVFGCVPSVYRANKKNEAPVLLLKKNLLNEIGK